jgi:hypothetical protein
MQTLSGAENSQCMHSVKFMGTCLVSLQCYFSPALILCLESFAANPLTTMGDSLGMNNVYGGL